LQSSSSTTTAKKNDDLKSFSEKEENAEISNKHKQADQTTTQQNNEGIIIQDNVRLTKQPSKKLSPPPKWVTRYRSGGFPKVKEGLNLGWEDSSKGVWWKPTSTKFPLPPRQQEEDPYVRSRSKESWKHAHEMIAWRKYDDGKANKISKKDEPATEYHHQTAYDVISDEKSYDVINDAGQNVDLKMKPTSYRTKSSSSSSSISTKISPTSSKMDSTSTKVSEDAKEKIRKWWHRGKTGARAETYAGKDKLLWPDERKGDNKLITKGEHKITTTTAATTTTKDCETEKTNKDFEVCIFIIFLK
jgi:hypothetical protein